MTIRRFVGNPGEEHVLAPSGGYVAGQLVVAPSGRLAYVGGQCAIAAGHPAVLHTKGILEIDAASSLVLTAGQAVYVNITTQAVVADPGADIVYGGIAAAKANGELFATLLLNEQLPATNIPIEVVVQEFDCDTNAADSALKTLISAQDNSRGLIVILAFGRVTEVFGGASQDQGVVTLSDSDSTTICTLTPSDAGADVIGDVVVGHDMTDLATGGALKIVPAGKSVRGQVTTPTTGAGAAGKMKVHMFVLPLA